jgi:large subunit ribosomal protein L10
LPIGTREPRADKVQEVAEIKKLLESVAVILTDYQGLDLKGLSELRKKLRESGGGYRVVKNTLFTLAAADTPAAPLAEGLVGPTAIAFGPSDPVATAKALQDFTKGPKHIVVKSGLVDGTVYSAKQIDALASIPPKEQLYAMVVGGLQSPITNLVGTLNSMLGQLVVTLQAVADKKAAA